MNITIVPYKKIQIADFPELFFGMSLNQFDEYFLDSKKSTQWDCQCRYIKLPVKGECFMIMANFSEDNLLEALELDFRNFCDENIIFTVNEDKATGYSQLLNLLCRSNDVRENDSHDTLGFHQYASA